MKRIFILGASLVAFLGANAQTVTANNGLTALSNNVSLGGTLNNSATSIDFGSSNSNSSLLFKKGTSNYFFVGNDGKIGIGTSSPAALVDITNGTNSFRFDPGTSILNISGPSVNVSQMPRLNFSFNGDANAAISFLTYAHDNLALSFDSYHNGTSWVSSSGSGNFALYKTGAELVIGFKSGLTAGTTFGGFDLTSGVRFSNDGKIGIGGAAGTSKLYVNGDLKVDGTATSQVQFTGPNIYNPGFVFNGSTANTHSYTFDSQNFATVSNGSSEFNGLYTVFRNNAYVMPWQQSLTIKKSWPGMGEATTLTIDNDNFNAVPSTYRIVSFRLTGTEKAWIDQTGGAWFNGKVGIGTTNLSDNNFKLFVETGIRTRKIKVDQLTWPDYVFHKAYNLIPIPEVEKFILQHNHLPGVPSAKEVEENGLDLGDNQATLLKKIEELTLYIIDQNKKIDQQQQQIKTLEAQQTSIKNLEAELEKIKTQLAEKK